MRYQNQIQKLTNWLIIYILWKTNRLSVVIHSFIANSLWSQYIGESLWILLFFLFFINKTINYIEDVCIEYFIGSISDKPTDQFTLETSLIILLGSKRFDKLCLCVCDLPRFGMEEEIQIIKSFKFNFTLPNRFLFQFV
jgi:hypothetical protein